MRIGEEQEKIISSLQKFNADLQSRLLTLESWNNLTDVNFQNIGNRTDHSSVLMAELAEKMEKRVHNLEEVISMMNSEQKAEKSKTARLEINDDGLWSHMNIL